MVRFHLQYELNRRQRIVPHLRIWSRYLPGLLLMLAVAAFVTLVVSVWFLPLLIGCLWLLRGFFVGLIDVALHATRPMDIVVEENGLGFLAGGERWWLPLDGILSVKRMCLDVWTVSHHNGSVIHIPAAVITEEQIMYLRAGADRRIEVLQALATRPSDRP